MQQNDSPWQTLKSTTVYQTPWMKVYKDTVRMLNGVEGVYSFVEGKPGVFIIALTDKGEIYLIEPFRYPTKKWQWELPTGGIDEGMTPLQTAKHELAEELGMTAEQWAHVNTYAPSSNGLMKDTQDVFVARGLHAGQTHHEDFEAIRAMKAVAWPEVLAMIAQGTLADGQSLAALMQFAVWREGRGV